MKLIKTLPRLLRIDSWVKNVLIIFPAFFGKRNITLAFSLQLMVAVFVFSLLCSCVYIINDAADVHSDRNHPVKKFRPIAAGHISVFNAFVICFLVCITGFSLAFLFLNKVAILLLLFYLAFNLLYTFYLKHLLIIEFYSIAIFFEIRLFYGGVIAGITVSHWLALTVFFLATLMAIGKRRDDALLQANSVQSIRTSTRYYNVLFFDTVITIISSLLVFIYIIYSVSDWVTSNYSKNFYLTDIFVIIGLSKYLHKIFVEEKSGDPVKVLYQDKFLLTCVLLWLLLVFKFIYYGDAPL